MGTAGRSDYRYHRATKIIVMESCRAHTIIAGTSFAMLITALRDDVELPEELPDTIPSAWLDNLDRYRIVLLLSTSKHGPKAIAGTAAEYELKIERRDSVSLLRKYSGLGDRGNGGRRNCPYRRIAGYRRPIR